MSQIGVQRKRKATQKLIFFYYLNRTAFSLALAALTGFHAHNNKLEFVEIGFEREENALFNNQDQPTTNSNQNKALVKPQTGIEFRAHWW